MSVLYPVPRSIYSLSGTLFVIRVPTASSLKVLKIIPRKRSSNSAFPDQIVLCMLGKLYVRGQGNCMSGVRGTVCQGSGELYARGCKGTVCQGPRELYARGQGNCMPRAKGTGDNKKGEIVHKIVKK